MTPGGPTVISANGLRASYQRHTRPRLEAASVTADEARLAERRRAGTGGRRAAGRLRVHRRGWGGLQHFRVKSQASPGPRSSIADDGRYLCLNATRIDNLSASRLRGSHSEKHSDSAGRRAVPSGARHLQCAAIGRKRGGWPTAPGAPGRGHGARLAWLTRRGFQSHSGTQAGHASIGLAVS